MFFNIPVVAWSCLFYLTIKLYNIMDIFQFQTSCHHYSVSKVHFKRRLLPQSFLEIITLIPFMVCGFLSNEKYITEII